MSSNFTVNKICEQCGTIFTAKTTVTRFCSKLCNKRNSKKRARDIKIAPTTELIEKVMTKTAIDLSSREFLSVKMAAKLLGASERIIYIMISSGRLNAINLSQRKTLIYRHDIDNLFKLPKLPHEPEKELEIADCYHMAEAQVKYNISEKALFVIIERHGLKKIRSGKKVYVAKAALNKIFNTQ